MLRAVLLPFLVATTTAFAGLKWDRPVQEFHCVPEDGFVETKFTFTNPGPNPLRIRKIQSSCGCTTARLAKRDFAPGEAGELVAKFTFGGRRGPQRKTILVSTDDGTEVILDLRVWIHDPLPIKPALVFWKVGDPLEPKSVELTASEGQKIGITSVSSTNPAITASVETIAPGSKYRLQVRPSSTAQKESAQIKIVTDFPAAAPRTYIVHLRIK